MRVFKSVLAGLLPLFLVAGPSRALAQQPVPAVEAKKPTAEDRKKLREKAFQLLDETVAEIRTLSIEDNQTQLFIEAISLMGAADVEKSRDTATTVVALLARKESALNDPENEGPISTTPQQERTGQAILSQYGETLTRLGLIDGPGALKLFQETRGAFAGRGEPWRTTALETLAQNLETMAARQNPEQLYEQARKLLKKGDLFRAMYQIPELAGNAPKLAEQLFSETLDALLASKEESENKILTLESMISMSRMDVETTSPTDNQETKARGPKVELSEGVRRKLFTEIARLALESVESRKKQANGKPGLEHWENLLGTTIAQSHLPEITKYAPELAARLKTLLEATERKPEKPRQDSSEDRTASFLAEIEAGKPETLQVLAQVIPSYSDILLRNGNADRLRKSLEKVPNEQTRKKLLRLLDEVLLKQRVGDGDIDPKELDRILAEKRSPEARYKLLIELADHLLERRNTEKAREFLDRALAMTSQMESSGARMTGTFEVAKRFLQFDPARAFDLYESQINPLNELLAAMATVGDYVDTRGEPLLRKGEFQLAALGFAAEYLPTGTLPFADAAVVDPDRAIQLVNRIRQPELRCKLRLEISKRLLTTDPTFIFPPKVEWPSDQKEETNPR